MNGQINMMGVNKTLCQMDPPPRSIWHGCQNNILHLRPDRTDCYLDFQNCTGVSVYLHDNVLMILHCNVCARACVILQQVAAVQVEAINAVSFLLCYM